MNLSITDLRIYLFNERIYNIQSFNSSNPEVCNLQKIEDIAVEHINLS